jgi:hypothetical protein
MKVFLLPLALAVGFVQAQGSIDGVPQCAQSCVTEWTSGDKIAGCKQLDFQCVCGNEEFISGIACCVAKDCDQQGQAATLDYAAQVCSVVGVQTPTGNVSDVCKENNNATGDNEGVAATLGSTAVVIGAVVAMALAF